MANAYKVRNGRQEDYDADQRTMRAELTALRQELAALRAKLATISASSSSSGSTTTAATTPVVSGGSSGISSVTVNTGDGLTVNGGATATGSTFTLALTAEAGLGTVTSVSLAAPSIFAVSGSPVTTSGTLTLDLATQSANTFFAGPTSGSAAAPTFRALDSADLPTSGVTAATYGDATHVGQFTVDATGRITAASSVSITGLGGGGSEYFVVSLLADGAGRAWASYPATATELFGVAQHRVRVDLTGCDSVRFQGLTTVDGGVLATAALRLQYSTDNGSTWAYFDTAIDGPGFLVAGTGLHWSGWKVVPVGAQGDVMIRAVGSNADDSVGITFTEVKAEFANGTRRTDVVSDADSSEIGPEDPEDGEGGAGHP